MDLGHNQSLEPLEADLRQHEVWDVWCLGCEGTLAEAGRDPWSSDMEPHSHWLPLCHRLDSAGVSPAPAPLGCSTCKPPTPPAESSKKAFYRCVPLTDASAPCESTVALPTPESFDPGVQKMHMNRFSFRRHKFMTQVRDTNYLNFCTPHTIPIFILMQLRLLELDFLQCLVGAPCRLSLMRTHRCVNPRWKALHIPIQYGLAGS